MLLLKGRQVDADIPQVEQNLFSSIVAPWANFKAAIACNLPQWCWHTDQVFRRLKGVPSEAQYRLAHHLCETVQKGAKLLLKCDMSIPSWYEISLDNSWVRTHMARHLQLSCIDPATVTLWCLTTGPTWHRKVLRVDCIWRHCLQGSAESRRQSRSLWLGIVNWRRFTGKPSGNLIWR